MKITAEFDGTQRLDESNLFMVANPDHGYIWFGDNDMLEGAQMYLDYDEAYLLYQMLERSLLFLSHQGQ